MSVDSEKMEQSAKDAELNMNDVTGCCIYMRSVDMTVDTVHTACIVLCLMIFTQ